MVHRSPTYLGANLTYLPTSHTFLLQVKKDAVILSDQREPKFLPSLSASNLKNLVILSDQREPKDLRLLFSPSQERRRNITAEA